MTYRPKDVAERLDISPATLRLWSTKFESYLSPGAQRSTTENGGASQRRYDDVDLVYFLRAKQLLADGLTYEEVSARLAEGVPIVEHNNIENGAESLPVPLISDVVVVSESVAQYEKTISALEQTITAQRETLNLQGILLEDLRRQRDAWESTPKALPALEPALPVLTFRQRLDWLLRGRMITGQREERRIEPEGSTQRPIPVQDGA